MNVGGRPMRTIWAAADGRRVEIIEVPAPADEDGGLVTIGVAIDRTRCVALPQPDLAYSEFFDV